MPAPSFIDIDINVVLSELIADYQAATGRTLVPTDVEYLMFQSVAYRETLLRASIQSAAEQNLVDFATGGVLDYLAALVGVERLPESASTTTLQFNIVSGHGGVIIPSGTRVQTTDGKVIFQTLSDYTVPLVDTVALLEVEAQQTGTFGNGYAVGTVTVLLDALAFVTSVSNTLQTAGGADVETDVAMRTRIKLAPSVFSTAGSRDAYRFHALSASANIVDVAVLGPPQTTPGTVEIYPLMEDGSTTPAQIIAAVELATTSERVRPLTDTVIVASPTPLNYTIDVELVAFVDADQTDVVDTVTANLNAFVLSKRRTLGQDITESQVIAQCQIAGVYSVSLIGWSDVIVADTEFPFNTALTVTITSTTTG